ncbi:visual pigment-like receptor peropsin [Mercenaria mercenaria]|uniref:visual pigment-like receptor peropsin n=1 Tax=Mercenaria mercenaria TaxID=6596 RepID=UPI001E1DC573|nr:visual pigment-like receptor peropsin [Mercenaria mercenaria]
MDVDDCYMKVKLIISVLFLLSAIASAIGNSLVLILVWRFKTLRNKTTILIINLAIADLGISVFGFPMSASSNFAHGWQMGQVGCQWYGFTGMLFGIGNIGLLTAISLDRYLLTCRHSVFLQLSVYHYIFLVLIVWGNALFWAMTPLLGWCRYALDPSGTACMVTWTDDTRMYTSYVMSVFVSSFLIPSVIIVFCYVNTWRFIRSVGDGGRQENVEWTHEKQVAKMCAIAVSLFLLAWTPYAVVCIWAAIGNPRTIPPLLLVAPTVFAKSSACYNPVLYALVNKRFRLAMRKLVGLGKTRRDKEEMRLHHFEG